MRLSSKIKHVFISRFQGYTIKIAKLKYSEWLTEQMNELYNLAVLEWAGDVVMDVFRWLKNIRSSLFL